MSGQPRGSTWVLQTAALVIKAGRIVKDSTGTGQPLPGRRVLVYGSRTWRNPAPIAAYIAGLPAGTVVVHGGQVSYDPELRCYYGADYLAHLAAVARGYRVEVHLAAWDRGRIAGPLRNREMVASGLAEACGYRMPGASPGTDDMTRQLAAAGVPYRVVTP